MAESILRDKSKEFAKKIVFLCRDIKTNMKESVLTNQLLRSGTSIGANIHEAQYAQGTKDFISKFEIALKEANETGYWLELLYRTKYALHPCSTKAFQITKNTNYKRQLFVLFLQILPFYAKSLEKSCIMMYNS